MTAEHAKWFDEARQDPVGTLLKRIAEARLKPIVPTAIQAKYEFYEYDLRGLTVEELDAMEDMLKRAI